MRKIEYYTKIANDFGNTQCVIDLLHGDIQIADVPLEFRGRSEFAAAHKFARGLEDEKERHHLFWKIAECMESDMINLQLAANVLAGKLPESDLPADIPDESEYFNLNDRLCELADTHEMYFNFPTQKLFF